MSGPFKQQEAARESATPYAPPGPPEPLIFDRFEGINTQTTRSGVDDKQCWWIDGFMPIGPRFLRTLYDIGPSIHTETNKQISFFDFGNIGATPYCIVLHSDGSVHAVNTSTLVGTEIAPAGTIQSPSQLQTGVSQWGSDVIIIVTQQTDGYFVWNGSILCQAGTLGPVVDITNGGSGYTSAPTVAASGGSGSGATFTATVDASGVVTAVSVDNPGSGYLVGNTVTLGFSGGGGSGAAASIDLMPFGISATAIEIYAGRVWLVDGPAVTFSAPGSYTDFSTTNGGGNFSSSDSFLRVGYQQLKQTNGFLYLFGDSSINYISGVQTTGSPPVTTFTNQNADPEVGTPWPSTVATFGRNIVFANAFGAHVSYGAAVTKISNELDGVYNTVPGFGGFVPSSAKAVVFARRLWILLLPIVDPITQQQVNKLLIWDGKKWWASEQSVGLLFIQSQEINSVLTAYGTDGNSIFPLFNTPSTAFAKRVQSKFWTKTQLELEQTVTRLWGAATYYSINSPDLTVLVESENSAAESTVSLAPTEMNWTTQTGAAMVWLTALALPMIWRTVGTAIIAPTAVTQNGVMLGLTAETSCDDMALIMLVTDLKVQQYRG